MSVLRHRSVAPEGPAVACAVCQAHVRPLDVPWPQHAVGCDVRLELQHRELEHRELEHRELEHRELEHRELEHRELEKRELEHRELKKRELEHRCLPVPPGRLAAA